jgi:hypothetical protein
MSLVLACCDSLGFLDYLMHVEMLLLSGISREDGELGELDAVLEGQPGTYARAFVWIAVHANLWVLGMHFVDNLVPLSLQIPDDKTTKHFVHLWASATATPFLDLRIPCT